MAYRPAFELASFDTLGATARQSVLVALVEVLIHANLEFLAQNRVPPIYSSGVFSHGVQYVFNFDRWQDIPSCLDRGQGDCKDVSAWRIAELRRQGIPALVNVISREKGRAIIYHVRVQRPDGFIEDPSIALGMSKNGAFTPPV